MYKFLRKRVVYHSLIWLVAVCFLVTEMQWDTDLSLTASIQEVLVTFIPLVIGIYGNFYLKATLIDKRLYLQYIISFIVLVIACTALFELIRYFNLQRGNSFGQNLVNLLFVFPTSLGLQYLKRGIVSQYQLQELKAKTVENELNALKAQLNPHFLFNTLNNIYGANQVDPDIGSDMILELSQLMRYHLNSSRISKVTLDSEIDVLKSYIKLEKLRLPDLHKTTFTIDLKNHHVQIAPLILLPLVENAYKHGTHSTKNSFVEIQCYIEADKMYFKIRNSVFQSKNTVKTGIGLENTIRRLNLIYGNAAKLTTFNNLDTFETTLILDLNS